MAWRLSICGLLLFTACATEGDEPAEDDESGGEETGDGAETDDGEADAAEDDTSAGDDGDSGADEGDTGAAADCASMTAGMNQLDVNGEVRSFVLSLPGDVDAGGGPWPVVFNWHGLGDTAENMSQLIAPHVDGPDLAFIGVTPEDADFQLMVPLLGEVPMDWDIFMVDESNRELALFDAVLACIDEKWGVDPDRVHSMGFSLGGIATDLIASMRSDVIASVATYSGGYWNNPNSELGLVSSVVSWPEHSATTAYPQLFIHGGETDTYSLGPSSIMFGDYAAADSAWLAELGHATFSCDHGNGHTAPAPDMGAAHLIRFFRDHPRGTVASPYTDAHPEDWPDYCTSVAAP